MKTEKLKKLCKLQKTLVKVFIKNDSQLFLGGLENFELELVIAFPMKN